MATYPLDSRIRAQVAAMVAGVLPVPSSRLRVLSVRELLVLCQQHGFDVEMTLDEPAPLANGDVGCWTEIRPDGRGEPLR